MFFKSNKNLFILFLRLFFRICRIVDVCVGVILLTLSGWWGFAGLSGFSLFAVILVLIFSLLLLYPPKKIDLINRLYVFLASQVFFGFLTFFLVIHNRLFVIPIVTSIWYSSAVIMSKEIKDKPKGLVKVKIKILTIYATAFLLAVAAAILSVYATGQSF